jgi:hypothetical protein
MVYRIVYHTEAQGSDRKSGGRRVFLTVMLFSVFCWIVCFCWPEGKQMLRILLIPGEPEVTIQAAEVFASELCSGYTLSDAVRNFCANVLENRYAG